MARTKAEIGALGLPIWAGLLSLDPDRNLRGARAIQTYREMWLNEPACGAFVTSAMNLFRTDLTFTPGGKTDADARAAEFGNECLADMRDSAATCLRQMYSIVWAGWDWHELVYKRRSGGNGSRYEDGRVGWAAWALRRQETLYRWDMDTATGRVQGLTQRPAPDYKLRTIPSTKGVHIVADDSEGSPEGRSPLRSMYRQWYMVKNLELLMGIALERFGTGVPVWELDEKAPEPTPAEITQIGAIVAGLRQNEEAGVVTPRGMRFRFAESPGLSSADYRETIQMMRVWMLATVIADFIALGTGQTGSFALGKDKSELFLLALNGYQDRVIQALQRQAVPRLFRYNDFGTLTDLPQLSMPQVRRYDLDALGRFAELLNRIGAFHPTPEDEEFFRKISDLVDKDIDELEELHMQDQAQPGMVACPNCGMLNSPSAAVCAQCGEPLPMSPGRTQTGQDQGQIENADEPGTDEEEVAVSGNGVEKDYA